MLEELEEFHIETERDLKILMKREIGEFNAQT